MTLDAWRHLRKAYKGLRDGTEAPGALGQPRVLHPGQTLHLYAHAGAQTWVVLLWRAAVRVRDQACAAVPEQRAEMLLT